MSHVLLQCIIKRSVFRPIWDSMGGSASMKMWRVYRAINCKSHVLMRPARPYTYSHTYVHVKLTTNTVKIWIWVPHIFMNWQQPPVTQSRYAYVSSSTSTSTPTEHVCVRNYTQPVLYTSMRCHSNVNTASPQKPAARSNFTCTTYRTLQLNCANCAVPRI